MKQTSEEPVTHRTDINPIFPTNTLKKKNENQIFDTSAICILHN